MILQNLLQSLAIMESHLFVVSSTLFAVSTAVLTCINVKIILKRRVVLFIHLCNYEHMLEYSLSLDPSKWDLYMYIRTSYKGYYDFKNESSVFNMKNVFL